VATQATTISTVLLDGLLDGRLSFIEAIGGIGRVAV